jgi:hypothetical protein
MVIAWRHSIPSSPPPMTAEKMMPLQAITTLPGRKLI